MKFNFRRPFSGVLFALALCLFFVTPTSSYGEPASKAVASFLRQNGLREGYDASRERLIMIGVAEQIMDLEALIVVSAPSFYVPQLAILKSGDQAVKPNLKRLK